jgi:hypothetical protein
LLIVFSLLQFYVVFAIAAPSLGSETALATVAPLQVITGRLTTRDNQPVTVNGNSMTSGGTILSGAIIETGDGVGATVHLGLLGSVDIAPNSKVQIEFSAGQIKVTIIQGCAIVRNRKGTFAQVFTDKGLATNNDPNQKQAVTQDVCYPSGAPGPIVNQGAAANAGAGSGMGDTTTAGGGLSHREWAAIILGGAAIGVPVALHRGRNPSPGTPRGRP